MTADKGQQQQIAVNVIVVEKRRVTSEMMNDGRRREGEHPKSNERQRQQNVMNAMIAKTTRSHSEKEERLTSKRRETSAFK